MFAMDTEGDASVSETVQKDCVVYDEMCLSWKPLFCSIKLISIQ